MFRLQTPLPDSYRELSTTTMEDRIRAHKERLGSSLAILGHHYQRDEVFQFADYVGDSFLLSKQAAANPEAEIIVFCGVHFMAESADILTADNQTVFLPDLNAGCSMADMANLEDVEDAWDAISAASGDLLVPITYMNSSAALKAFTGKNDGAVCTSSNARPILEWALSRQADTKILFFPDQHLGRNTALNMGFTPDDLAVWDPRQEQGGLSLDELRRARFILWKGHCSVHQRFKPIHVEAFREAHPTGIVLAHPECAQELVVLADGVGSTEYIINAVTQAPPGSVIGVATEIHLVNRLAQLNPDKTVVSLDPLVCPCSTMFRIDLPHLLWLLDEIEDGNRPNVISVDEETSVYAKLALDRMLKVV